MRSIEMVYLLEGATLTALPRRSSMAAAIHDLLRVLVSTALVELLDAASLAKGAWAVQ